MAYLKDPRENTIDLEVPAIWEADNRVEERWKWNAMIIDYCDMSPEEYMKNPVVESIKSAIEDASSSTSEEIKEAIENATDEITDAIDSASTTTNDNIDESTDEIISAITAIAEAIESGIPKDIVIYYTSVNSQIDYNTLTTDDFERAGLTLNSSIYIDYILGDPTPEQYAEYVANPTQEAEDHLREVASNSYYLAVPSKYEKRQLIIMENDISNVSDDFVEVEQNIFSGYKLYQAIDVDYFNEDYPDETNVKQSHKITIMK